MTNFHIATKNFNEKNQDAYHVGSVNGVQLAMLMDGAGNAEMSAKRAIKQAVSLVNSEGFKPEQQAHWHQLVKYLDSFMVSLGFESTFIGGAVSQGFFIGSYSGNSRMYLVRDGKAELITDNTKHLLGSGYATNKPILVPLKSNDVILLMSDGLWTKFNAYTLQEAVKKNLSKPPDHMPLDLVERSMNQIDDDMTVISMIVTSQSIKRVRAAGI